MNSDGTIEIARQAIITTLMLAGPLLAVAVVVALVVGVVQAMTQVQDQTISAVPKILALLIAIGVSAPWLLEVITEYTRQVIQTAPDSIVGK